MTNHCEKCCTRFDACAECKDAEIAALKSQILRMRNCDNCGTHVGWCSHCKYFDNCARTETYSDWTAFKEER